MIDQGFFVYAIRNFTMTLQQLGQQLNKMYFESNDGESVAMIHLFRH